MTIIRFPLLEWAESTVAEFSSDSVSEVGQTVRGPNRLGRTIRGWPSRLGDIREPGIILIKITNALPCAMNFCC